MLNHAEKSNAYAKLTRELRAMHHTERTILDTDPAYEAIMTAVHVGDDAEALRLAAHIHTTAGDSWRARAAR